MEVRQKKLYVSSLKINIYSVLFLCVNTGNGLCLFISMKRAFPQRCLYNGNEEVQVREIA